MARVSCAVLLRDLRRRERARRPAAGDSVHCLWLGTAHSIPPVDDCSVLVARHLLRSVRFRVRHSHRARQAWPAAGDRAAARRRLLHLVSAEVCVYAAGERRDDRAALSRAGPVRSAVQRGAIAPRRTARDLVAALCEACRPDAMAAAHVVWLDWTVGAHDVSASRLRRADGRAARRLLSLPLPHST